MRLSIELHTFLADNFEEFKKHGFDIYIQFSPFQKINSDWLDTSKQNFEEIEYQAKIIKKYIEKPHGCDPDFDQVFYDIFAILDDLALHATIYINYFQIFASFFEPIENEEFYFTNNEFNNEIKNNITLIVEQNINTLATFTNLYTEVSKIVALYEKLEINEISLSEFFQWLYTSTINIITIWNKIRILIA